jgi:hypothetical protein
MLYLAFLTPLLPYLIAFCPERALFQTESEISYRSYTHSRFLLHEQGLGEYSSGPPERLIPAVSAGKPWLMDNRESAPMR